jgi:anti-sigma regulatory factor (Ser/Thr protein kinase)
MDALLIDRWLEGAAATPIHDEASVVLVREEASARAKTLGLSEVDAGAIATIVSELAHNQIAHARDGRVVVRELTRGADVGIEVVAADRGEGIADPSAAIDGASTRPGGLGIGLSGAMRLADEIDFDIRAGEGTCVRARKLRSRASRRREAAVLSRPCEGERISGDDAIVIRTARGLRLALADGLGHGPEARAAASRAIDVVRTSTKESLVEILEHADAALVGTRGAVMTIVEIDELANELAHCAVGNVTTQATGPSSSRSFTGSSLVLGSPRAARRLHAHEERIDIAPGAVITLSSDGLKTSARVDVSLLRRHPIVIANQLVRSFARENDDATVLVVA